MQWRGGMFINAPVVGLDARIEPHMANSIVIWERTAATMVSSWTDEIICTQRKDGTFSLRQRCTGEEGIISPAGQSRIRSPEAFVHLLLEMDDSISSKEIAEKICERMDELDRDFSHRVRDYIRANF
jgi:hypothetical protein